MTRASLDVKTQGEVTEVTAASGSIHFAVGTAVNTKKGERGKPPEGCVYYP